jgi:septal ring factor EnvC (AmiA/AmiB activator)
MTIPRLTMIFFLVALGLMQGSSFVCAAADPAESSKQELLRIRRQMEEKKRDLKRARGRERSVLAELEKLERSMQQGAEELADNRARLRDAEDALREMEKSNIEMSRELDGLQRSYGQRVRALYKMGRSSYAVAILTSDSFYTALKRLKYLGIIAGRDRAVISQYGIALEQLSAVQAETAGRKEEITRRRLAVEAQKTELVARRREKAGILNSVRSEKGVYEQTLRELEESSASLWAMINREEKEGRTARKQPEERNAMAAGTVRFPWPVAGQVLTRFGMQRHPQFKTTIFRRGIEIGAQVGDTVRAINDGQVAFADWYKGYGKLLIIEHAAGFYSLYGNLEQIALAKGARVSKGQAVGLVGDTGSLKGPKLYFEIRYKGEAQDPLAWLMKQ